MTSDKDKYIDILLDFGTKEPPQKKYGNISELERTMLENGDIIDDRRDWTIKDAFKQGVRTLLTPNPHSLTDYEDKRLIGLSPEEFEQKAGGAYRALRMFDPATRDEYLRGNIASRQRFDTMMNAIADYFVPQSEEPYKKPEGFWDKALFKTVEAIPSIGATAAEIATLGVVPTITHQTISGNNAANESVFQSLVSQGMSPEQAYTVATDPTINIQDLLLRGVNNIATMYFLSKTPVANVGGASPYMQAAGNVGAAAATSGVGSAAEQAVTNVRGDNPNDPLELAETGGLSAFTTGALGALGAIRNRRYLREQQRLHRNMNNFVNPDYTDSGVVEDSTLSGEASKLIPPDEPIFPSNTEVITVPPEVVVGKAPITDPAANARQQTFSSVMIKHGLNPEAGTNGIAVAYRNGLIDDSALNDIASVLAPENPTQTVASIKESAANMSPLVKADNIPVSELLNPPQINKEINTAKPKVQRYTNPNKLITDYVDENYSPRVQKPDIIDPLVKTENVPINDILNPPQVKKGAITLQRVTNSNGLMPDHFEEADRPRVEKLDITDPLFAPSPREEPQSIVPMGETEEQHDIPKPEAKEEKEPVQSSEGEGYINSIEVLFNGDTHGAHVYLDKTPQGEEYLDIADDNGNSVAVYNPETDEFFVRPEYQKTGWVRELEDSFRNNLKPSEDIIKAANEGKLSDGLYDFFGVGLEDEKDKGQPSLSEQTKAETQPSITPLGQSEKKKEKPVKQQPKEEKKPQQDKGNDRTWGNWGYDDKLPPEPKQPKRDAPPEEWTQYYRDLLTYVKAKKRLDEYNAEINGKLYIEDARENDMISQLERIVEEPQKEEVKSSTPAITPLAKSEKPQPQPQPKTEQPKSKPAAPAPETKPAEAVTPAKTEEDDIVAKSQRLADRVKDAISSGNGFKNNNDFAAAANEAFDGTRGQGVHSVKEDYDAMEMGVNKYIMETGINPSAANDTDTAKADLAKLVDVMNMLPTQANRTEEQIKLQQFSTPPNLAYAVNWLANIQKGDVVLEPSAGLGGLAVFAKNAGGKLILNEYSPRRAKLLKSIGLGDVYKEDALSLNNILRPRFEKENKRLPNKVIMNPPFSTAVSTNKKSADNAIKHVEQALEFMADGGRLVAILGKETTSRPVWKAIANNYNVRAVYNLDGSNYRKYGTTYDNQIVVIDKTPKDGTETRYYKLPSSGKRQFENIFDDLKDIRDNAPKSTYTEPETPSEEPQVKAEEERAENKTPSTEQTETKAETPKPSEPAAPKTKPQNDNENAEPKETAKPKQQKASDLDSGKPPKVLAEWEIDGKKRRSVTEIVNNKDNTKVSVKGATTLATEQKSALEKEAKLNEKRGTPAIATHYITSLDTGTPHPANVNEAISLAAQPLPPLQNKTIPLPQEMIDSGAISSAQLEAVVYALQANEEINTIDNVDYNCAAFLADGTGMGKGRTIAAYIHATIAKGYGNGKAVWVSVDAKKEGLFKEAQGHYADIGDDPHDMFSQTLMPAKSKITRDRGILFTAYSTLRTKSAADSGKFPRMEQMCDWLGEDFDGAIVFDECHTANNLVATQGKRGKTKTSDTATVIAKIQTRYPKAKILYASATGATELKQLAAYPRLGIWGDNKSFNNEIAFRKALEHAGLSGMELIIRSLKAQGRWFARSLSMEDVTFRTLDTPLTEQQHLIYDEVARAWRAVQKGMQEASKVIGISEDGKMDAKTKMAFHSARQRAMNMLLTYFKVPAMIADIEKQLKAGNSVVVQLTNTNEPKKDNSKKETNNEAENEDVNFNISPITSLIELVKKKFPIHELETYEDENEKEQTRVKTDSQGNPIVSAKAKAIQDELIKNIKSIKFRNPLDMIINHFGVDNVVEVTGRSQRQIDVFTEVNGEKVKTGTQTQKWGKDYGMADKKNFDNGQKRILIFSEAGSTGVSYHAGRQFKNQQKRIHYLLQAGWRAETAMQGLGRTHRTNQAQAPEYILVSTDVPGERRFLSSIARRLLQLGALSSGERKSTTQGIFSERDNLESREAKAALQDLVTELLQTQFSNFHGQEAYDLIDVIDPPKNEEGGINEKNLDFAKIFNGLLAVSIDTQKNIYAKFDTYGGADIFLD